MKLMSDSGRTWLHNALADGRITQEELDVCELADAQGDLNLFLGYFTLRSDIESYRCPICQMPHTICRNPEKHRDRWEPCGFQLWPWQAELLSGMINDHLGNLAHTVVVMGGPGSGKSTMLAAMGAIYCALNPGFIFLCPAPSAEQNNAVMREFKKYFGEGTRFWDVFVAGSVNNPSPQITFRNASEYQLFTTAALTGKTSAGNRNLGKEGDVCVYDEAGIDPAFANNMLVLGGRMRGVRADGSPRGVNRQGTNETLMLLISNPHPENVGWDNFIHYCKETAGFAVLEVPTTANRAISTSQAQALRDRIIASVITSGGDILDAAAILAGEEGNAGSGEVFTKPILEKLLDANYELRVIQQLYRPPHPGNLYLQGDCIPGRLYHITVDPGYRMAPHRNAPAVAVWDVTDIKNVLMVALYWGALIEGEATHYLSTTAQLIERYACFATIDTTGPQVLILGRSELAGVKERLVPMAFGAEKAASQTIMQQDCMAGYFKMPDNVYIKRQLKQYTWADNNKSLPQDLVCTLLIMASVRRIMAMRQKASDAAAQTEEMQRYTTMRDMGHDMPLGHRA